MTQALQCGAENDGCLVGLRHEPINVAIGLAAHAARRSAGP